MTPEQAKDLLPIIKAYSEGKQIQFLENYNSMTWQDLYNPSFESDPTNYRIKPDPIVVKYRRYIYKSENIHYVRTVHEQRYVVTAEKFPEFVRWIDTDWVTENV